MKTSIYPKFKDYNDFKIGAEFFKRGSIVPARIAKFSRKRDTFSSRLVFEHDTYMRMVDGVMFLLPEPFQFKNGRKCWSQLDNCQDVDVKCAPYCKGLNIIAPDEIGSNIRGIDIEPSCL